VDTAGWYRCFAEVEASESSPTYRLLADGVAGDHVVLATLRSPVALIEVGASAGLSLFPDRYRYSYNGAMVGDSPVHIEVECTGAVPIPSEMPEVCWRSGVDLNPLDVNDSDDVARLRACIWPEHHTRRGRLDRAIEMVAPGPPRIVRGDLNEEIDALIDSTPTDATTFVFHSAVLWYLSPQQRRVFAATMIDRPDVVWISNEAPGVVTGLDTHSETEPQAFVLELNGTQVLAHSDPPGGWLAWSESG
jgi:hypothetical protein